MSILKNLFGHSTTGQTQGISPDHWDALGYYEQQEILQRVAQSNNQAAMSMLQQVQYNQAANSLRGASMAGGAMVGGMIGATASQVGLGQMNAYNTWGHGLTAPQIRDKTRNHIANEVEKMAEEIGAPTLLHAVVLAIRTMEIPE